MSVPTLAGIYALPRGGSNFLSAWLHYHPEIFAVSERYMDWRKPLWRYWTRRSILKRHGVQGKRIADTRCIVFNKVQRDLALWGAKTDYPQDTRMIFYLRNPARIFMSRDVLGKVRTNESWWAASDENLNLLMSEIQTVLETYRYLREKRPCLLLSHEYFCCHHLKVLPELYRFLGVSDDVVPNPRKFLRKWESADQEMHEERDERGTSWLMNPSTGERLSGYGGFNPLRDIDPSEIGSDEWKLLPDIAKIMDTLRLRLGDEIADYYWKNDYDSNIRLA